MSNESPNERKWTEIFHRMAEAAGEEFLAANPAMANVGAKILERIAREQQAKTIPSSLSGGAGWAIGPFILQPIGFLGDFYHRKQSDEGSIPVSDRVTEWRLLPPANVLVVHEDGPRFSLPEAVAQRCYADVAPGEIIGLRLILKLDDERRPTLIISPSPDKAAMTVEILFTPDCRRAFVIGPREYAEFADSAPAESLPAEMLHQMVDGTASPLLGLEIRGRPKILRPKGFQTAPVQRMHLLVSLAIDSTIMIGCDCHILGGGS